MKEKEAKRIVSEFNQHPAWIHNIAQYEYAKGYLEAIAKAKRLEEALDSCLSCVDDCRLGAEEVLANWEKEK